MKLGTFVVIVNTVRSFATQMSNTFDAVQQLYSVYSSVTRLASLLNCRSRRQDLDRARMRRRVVIRKFNEDTGIQLQEDCITIGPGTFVQYAQSDEDGSIKSAKLFVSHKGLLLAQGQILALYTPEGSNTAGKTTFLKALAQIVLPRGGFVDFPENLRVRYIPMEPELFNKTVRENLCFGNQHPHSMEETRELCKLFKLSPYLYEIVGSNEDGTYQWATPIVGANGCRVALSDRIRIVLIRALLSSVDLLLLNNTLDMLAPPDAAHILKQLKVFIQERGMKCLKSDTQTNLNLRKKKTIIVSTRSPHIGKQVHNYLDITDC